MSRTVLKCKVRVGPRHDRFDACVRDVVVLVLCFVVVRCVALARSSLHFATVKMFVDADEWY